MQKRLAVIALLATAASQASAAAVYEQFNYNAGDLGTVSSPAWTATTLGTGDVQVQVGSPNASLQFTDANPSYTLGTPAGNLAQLSNQRGKSDRISTSPLGTGSGTLFYSLLLRVSDLTNATTSGGFIAGFNNSVGTALTNITQAGARLQIRRSLTDGTKYNLGIRNDVSGSTGTSVLTWDTVDRTVGDTLFIVGEYEFNLSSFTDDVARLWINPNPADLGAASPPATTLTSTGGDINQLQIQSFFLRQVSGAAVPRLTEIDELRLDSTWAGVTPVPEPGMFSLLGVGAASLLRRRRQA